MRLEDAKTGMLVRVDPEALRGITRRHDARGKIVEVGTRKIGVRLLHEKSPRHVDPQYVTPWGLHQGVTAPVSKPAVAAAADVREATAGSVRGFSEEEGLLYESLPADGISIAFHDFTEDDASADADIDSQPVQQKESDMLTPAPTTVKGPTVVTPTTSTKPPGPPQTIDGVMEELVKLLASAKAGAAEQLAAEKDVEDARQRLRDAEERQLHAMEKQEVTKAKIRNLRASLDSVIDAV